MSTDALIKALKEALGETGVITDAADLAPHLVEERGLYQGTSPALVKPANTEQVSEIVKLCAAHNTPAIAHGGNTGLVGAGVPDGAVIVDFSRMNKIVSIDAVNLTMVVEAGAILADVQRAAEDAGAYFPLSLGAEGSCRIGGNLSTNAGGVHVVRYGNARQLVLGLEVVLADGRVWDGLRALRKDNTGYQLKELFLGAEGTLGLITRAVLRLYPKPLSKSVAFAGCASFDHALNLFQVARGRAGDVLMACEAMSDFSVAIAEKHIEGTQSPLEGRHGCYVLLEFGSSDPQADLDALMEKVLGDAFEDMVIEDAVIAQSGAQAESLWKIREAIPEAQKKEGGSIKHDVAVPVSKTAEMIARASELVEKLIPGVRVVAFGHLGDGNIHFNLSQPENADKAEFLGHWHAVNEQVHDLVVSMGGSFSAEHGVGQLKTGEMARFKSEVELDLMRTLKTALDPQNLLNPGKVLPPKG
ncbi:FAD-binding oxidoreductase [Magnetovibrio sp.]|uniref:FAD-binding oxidoreductase n=1 Tax=Magnetovibrio sp. TaxID=2024836 RepID=UPI002F92DB9E